MNTDRYDKLISLVHQFIEAEMENISVNGQKWEVDYRDDGWVATYAGTVAGFGDLPRECYDLQISDVDMLVDICCYREDSIYLTTIIS